MHARSTSGLKSHPRESVESAPCAAETLTPPPANLAIRVVVPDDDARGVRHEGSSKQLTRMDDGAVDGAPVDLVISNQTLLGGEKEDAKYFDGFILHDRGKHRGCLGGLNTVRLSQGTGTSRRLYDTTSSRTYTPPPFIARLERFALLNWFVI